MITPTILAACAAIGISLTSAALGVGMARIIWAEDLLHARQLGEIRDRTEGHLRDTVAALRGQIAAKDRTIAALEGRLGK